MTAEPIHKFKDLCTKIGSGSTPKGGESVYLKEGTALIRSQNIHNLDFRGEGLVFIGDDIAKKMANVSVQERDILLNITGDSVARSCLVQPSILPARVNQHVAIIRTKREKLIPEYLSYFLVLPVMQAQMLSLAGSGGTRKALTKGMIEKFEINAPSLVAQQKILDHLIPIDNLIENNKKRIALLEEATRLLYREWFLHFRFPNYEKTAITHGLPSNWELEKIVNHLDFVRGVEPGNKQYQDSPSDGAVPFNRVGDIGGRNSNLYINVEFAKGRLLSPQDIVITMDATPGRVGLGYSGAYSSGIRKIVFKEGGKISWAFCYALLKSDAIQSTIKQHASGTTILHASSSIPNMTVAIPPKKILEAFESTASPMLKQILTLKAQSDKLVQARDLLLPRLMDGRIKL